MDPCSVGQRGNWEQTGDESGGALLMGACFRSEGEADMSVGGSSRIDAPPLQGDETRHPFPDGGIERDLFALPPKQIHAPPPPLLFPHLIRIILSRCFSSLHSGLFVFVGER